jgi:hypothetical protein
MTFITGSAIGWRATVTTSTLPHGGFVLTITATDVFANVASQSINLFHSVPPTLTIDAPEIDALARPTVHVKMSCRDADGLNCKQVFVYGDSSPNGNTAHVLASGTTSVDQDVSLAQFDFDGKVVYLTFRGIDVNSDTQNVTQQVEVETSPYLVEVVRVPGPVLDDDDTRTLYRDYQNQAFIFDKTSGQTTPVAGYRSGIFGYLTPTGAIFGDIGLNVSSPWAMFGDTGGLELEDLRTQAITTLDTFSSGTGGVAANGDVAAASVQIARYRNGTKTVIAPNSPGWLPYPLTDGVNVAYRSGGAVQLFTDPANISLGQPLSSVPRPHWDYALAGGWVAYTQEGLAKARNTWVRSPLGVTTQVTFFGNSQFAPVAPQIAALNSDGRVSVSSNRRQLLCQAGGQPVDIGGDWNYVEPANGLDLPLVPSSISWRNNTLYMRVGRSVLRLVTAKPNAPTSLQTTTAPGQIQLAWHADPDARSYTIKRGLVGGLESVLATGVTGTTFTDTSGIAGATYYYVVSATNGLGESTNSTEVTAVAPLVAAPRVAANFDRDGRADLVVFRPATGHWFVRQSHSGYSYNDYLDLGWGLWDDVPIAADFDGDGQTDVVIYRPATGMWYVRGSATGYNAAAATSYQWGQPGDVPLAGDFDGDGRADLAVYRPTTATWYIRFSSSGYSYATAAAYQWGTPPGDIPLVADVDGDGRADLVIYRPTDGTWYFRTSSSGYTSFIQYQWGLSGDLPVAADFDGDGRMDLAVYRPSNGTWYVRFSSSGYSYANWVAYQWGLPGDEPVVADLDGDGRADLVVWRPVDGTWYVRYSADSYSYNTWQAFQWGLLGDLIPWSW